MKFNWGTGITLSFIFFMIFILTCIFITTREDIVLVSENYYEEELKYQEIIDRKNNTNKLESSLKITQQRDSIYFKFPTSIRSGYIFFYKVNTAAEDVKIPLTPLVNSSLVLSKSQSHIKSGNYKIIVKWDSENGEFFDEQFHRIL